MYILYSVHQRRVKIKFYSNRSNRNGRTVESDISNHSPSREQGAGLHSLPTH